MQQQHDQWEEEGRALREKLQKLTGERDALAGQTVGLQGEVDSLTGERDALAGQTVDLQGEVDSLSR